MVRLFLNFLFCFSLILSFFYNYSSYADQLDNFIEDIENENYQTAEKNIREFFQEKFQEEINPFENCYSIDEVKSFLMSYDKKCLGLLKLINYEIDRNGSNGSLVPHEHYQLFKAKILEGLRKNGLSRDMDSLNAYYLGLDALSLLKTKIPFEKRDEDKDKEEDRDEHENKENKEDKENPWDSDSDFYAPRNKDFSTESSGDDKIRPILIETNAPLSSPYMGAKIYETINAKGWSRSSIARKSFYKETSNLYDYKVFTFGQNNIPLPLPLGYRPVLSDHLDPHLVNIQSKGPEEYLLQYKGEQKIIELKLQKMELDRGQFSNSYFNFRLKQRYASKTGVSLDLYPDAIKDWVSDIKNKNIHDHLSIADALAAYIKKEFSYYSSDEFSQEELNVFDNQINKMRNEGVPAFIAMARIKVIQCDGTATLMASILRDFFEIPVRIVSGRTAVKRGGKNTVVRANDPLHAWIQVWDLSSGWREVDGTPDIKKNKKDKKENHDIKDTPIGDKKSEPEPEDLKTKELVDQQINPESILKEVLQGNQVLNDEDILRKIMEFRLSMAASYYAQPQEKLEDLKSSLLFLKELMSGSQSSFKKKIKTLIEEEMFRIQEHESTSSRMFLTYMKDHLRQGQYGQFYDDLIFIIKDFQFLQKFRPLTESENSFLSQLKDIQRELERINHPDSKAYFLVYEFMKKLPGNLSRSILMEEYGGERAIQVGTESNKKLAKAIIDSKESSIVGMKQMTVLNQFAQFKTNKIFRPSFEVVYEGSITSRKQKQKTEIPVVNVMDISSVNLPLKTLNGIMVDFVSGELTAKGYRQAVSSKKVVVNKQTIVTVILVDESGSMEGERKIFSQALISAYIDKVKTQEINDKNITHEVLIIPFSDDLGKISLIKAKEFLEGKNYIKSFLRSRSIIGGGTDIQKALIAAYQEIARAYNPDNSSLSRKSKKNLDLRKANIWLISDGESSIDKTAISTAKSQIPEDVSILLHVTQLGNGAENGIMKELANSYANVSENEILQMMNKKEKTEEKEGFISLLSAKDLPYTIVNRVNDLDINRVKKVEIKNTLCRGASGDLTRDFNVTWDLNSQYSLVLNQVVTYFFKGKSQLNHPLINIFFESLKGKKIHPLNYKQVMTLLGTK